MDSQVVRKVVADNEEYREVRYTVPGKGSASYRWIRTRGYSVTTRRYDARGENVSVYGFGKQAQHSAWRAVVAFVDALPADVKQAMS